MRVTCLQMDVQFACVEENFLHAEKLIGDAMADAPDVIVLPETWNTGFFPRENLTALADRDCAMVRDRIGALARKYGVNIVAGSVANIRGGQVYNTACVFDRTGACIARYDKTHLFSPMGEDQYFAKGNHLCTFALDGIPCGLIICYDLRFPEMFRLMSEAGARIVCLPACFNSTTGAAHWEVLLRSIAVLNHCYVLASNHCGKKYNGNGVWGHSMIIDPWGTPVALAGQEREALLLAEIDLDYCEELRGRLGCMTNRRPDIYRLEMR